MRVAIIASSRHPIAEPFAGGLESHVWSLADGLRRRGHDVTLFAGPGSDPRLGVEVLDLRRPEISAEARHDVSMIPERWLDEHHAYLDLMLRLSGDWDGRFDVIHNHSLHHLPIAMAPAVRTPMVSTLHTPPTPWLESAIQCGDGCPVTFAAVSAHTAAAWRGVVPDARVVPNGVDTEQWHEGPGGGPLVWFGRIVPEKGPHLALDAARRAGMPIVLAGPIADRAYFDREVRPGSEASRGSRGTSSVPSSSSSWAVRERCSRPHVGMSPTVSSPPRHSLWNPGLRLRARRDDRGRRTGRGGPRRSR